MDDYIIMYRVRVLRLNGTVEERMISAEKVSPDAALFVGDDCILYAFERTSGGKTRLIITTKEHWQSLAFPPPSRKPNERRVLIVCIVAVIVVFIATFGICRALITQGGGIGTAVTGSDAIQEYQYIGNKKSGIFHKASCGNLPDTQNRIYYKTRSEAVADGMDPCQRCKP